MEVGRAVSPAGCGAALARERKAVGLGPRCNTCHAHMAKEVIYSPVETAKFCSRCHDSINSLKPSPEIPARACDAPDRRKPQSRAIGIRAEEGTEDSRQVFFRDASSIVLNFDHHLSACSVFTVAFTQSHDYDPISINSLDGLGEQSMQGDFDLRRVDI